MPSYQSWGRLPKATPAAVRRIYWRSELVDLDLGTPPVLPFGLGRSYGDSCLNDGGVLIDTSHLSRLIHFDSERGIVRAEAGISLERLLAVIVPRGWFLPVSPGTQFVTLAGAVANDIHGKNHHRAGTFGCHVRRFELWRSDGTRRECSPDENAELFRATIAGMGLTGLISWVEIQLVRIASPCLQMERIRFRSFEEYLALEEESSADYEYTVSWVDCLRSGPMRGLFQRANFSAGGGARGIRRPLRVPFDMPSFALNSTVVKCFNQAIFQLQRRDRISRVTHYAPFFYPLDRVLDWNRIYGKRGFYQYQFLVPNDAEGGFQEILRRISASRQGSFLAILKRLGRIASPGLMSFPREGLTLALDFPNRGQTTLDLLEELDDVVRAAGGCVYPAKDARMSAASFQSYYPQWKEFSHTLDPRFSSSFWRRVTAGAGS
ncbi:MAG: FAD-binding oxidoreductase [Myxococcales bacterium]|nr:FAD-binding oxidoreductase [Myxococcales bacterium]